MVITRGVGKVPKRARLLKCLDVDQFGALVAKLRRTQAVHKEKSAAADKKYRMQRFD